MNDKFFELKKEKQDRMINGAIQVFSQKGYQHASTDDMVKAAGISKGLWFHYFENKIGLYEFMCEYCVRYFCMELSTVVDAKETNYYEVIRQSVVALERIIKIYPFLPLFLYQIKMERDMEAVQITIPAREKMQNKMNSILKNVEISNLNDRKDKEMMNSIMIFTLEGIINEKYRETELNVEKMIHKMRTYIDKMQKLFSTKEEMRDID